MIVLIYNQYIILNIMKATKGSKTSSKSSGAPKATASGSSSQASRSAAPNKNTKEAFLKKLKLCM
jgi:hypothetical protein